MIFTLFNDLNEPFPDPGPLWIPATSAPDETWPIFQPSHFAVSAPLIEIFMWLHYDPDGEGPGCSTNVLLHKKQLTEAFPPIFWSKVI